MMPVKSKVMATLPGMTEAFENGIFNKRSLRYANSPGRPEHVEWLGEDIIVDESGVQAEYGHHEYDVAATEEYLPHLVVLARAL